jgi:hypothetical protein
MFYNVAWSEGAKQALHALFPNVERIDSPDSFIHILPNHVAQEIALFPLDGYASPDQRFTGDLRIDEFRVRYEIHMDTGVAVITEITPDSPLPIEDQPILLDLFSIDRRYRVVVTQDKRGLFQVLAFRWVTKYAHMEYECGPYWTREDGFTTITDTPADASRLARERLSELSGEK